MIGSLRGKVLLWHPPEISVEVQGMGFDLKVPAWQLPAEAPSGELFLFTHMVVREDDCSLYGFFAEEHRALFRLLIGCKGVGPNIALGLLSKMAPEALCHALQTEDAKALARLPGLGKKTAERLILESRGKVDGLLLNAEPSAGAGADTARREAAAALIQLGYGAVEAENALAAVAAAVAPDAPAEQWVTLALANKN